MKSLALAPLWRNYKSDQTRQELKSFFTLLILLFASIFIFQDYEIALVWTSGLLVHEMGHIAGLSIYRIKWKIGLGWMGIWTESPLTKRELLTDVQNSVIHLAGPVFNLLYAGTALLANAIFQPNHNHLQVLAGFNATLAILNLIPLLNMSDGGKVISRMGVGQNWSGRIVLAVIFSLFFAGFMVFGIIFVQGQTLGAPLSQYIWGYLLLGGWSSISILIASLRNRFSKPISAKGLTLPQSLLFVFLIWILMTISVLIMWSSPFFLDAAHMLLLVDSVSQIILVSVSLLLVYITLQILPQFSRLIFSLLLRFKVKQVLCGLPESGKTTAMQIFGLPLVFFRKNKLQVRIIRDLKSKGSLREGIYKAAAPISNIFMGLWVLFLISGWSTGLQMDSLISMSRTWFQWFILIPVQGGVNIVLSASNMNWLVQHLQELVHQFPLLMIFAGLNLFYALFQILPWRSFASDLVFSLDRFSVLKNWVSRSGIKPLNQSGTFLSGSWVLIGCMIYRIISTLS